MKTKALLFTFLLFSFCSFGQIQLEGKVTDTETNKALPFCSVGLAGKSLGTLTNDKGEFILKIPLKFAEDTLQISFVGYKVYKVALKSLDLDKRQTFSLSPMVKVLKEVVVLDIDGVMKKAFKAINQNYQRKPVLMQGFYRETVKIPQKDTYFAFAEGVLEMYKTPVNSNNDRVRMLKGRKKELPFYFQQDGQRCLIPNITNGPNLGVLLDFVKHDDSFLFTSEFAEYHFSLDEITTLDGDEVYVIDFKPSNNISLFEGKIFIEKQSLAFVRAEYHLTKFGIERGNTMLKIDNKIVLKERKYQVSYAKNNGVWYFHDATVNNFYSHVCQQTPLESQMNFVITQIDFDNIKKFTLRESIKIDESFSEQTMVFDEEFWKDYNIIKF